MIDDLAVQMFPRHVLEYMVRDGGSLNAAVNTPAASNLARTHEGVTLMFMDIIGEEETGTKQGN